MKFRNAISGPIFCADAPDVVIETADAADIDVRLSISGFIWQYVLSPVAEQSGYVATIKTRDILEALIEPSGIGIDGPAGVPVVEITAGAGTDGSISMSFQALYGSAAGKTPAGMARHWLTWRDQISATFSGSRERLTFLSGLDLLGWKSGSYTVTAKIYTASSTVQATLASGSIPAQVSYISVDASPAEVLAAGEVSDLLAYDLSFSLSGTDASGAAVTAESFPLRLVLGRDDPRAKEFIYVNSLGVEDRVTAYGIRKDGLEGGSSKFVNGGVEREHGNDAQEQFEVYSGHLATARSVEQWIEFLKSSERYLSSGVLKGIVIDEYNTEVQEGELSSVSFTYRLSERIRGFYHDDSESIGDYDPKQKYGALIVGDVPDAANPPAEDLFFLKTRLDEFPLVGLSQDYLFLVQSPVSHHWGAASLSSIKEWLIKEIDYDGISLASVWASLTNAVADPYASVLISEAHIPALPFSKVDGLAEILSDLNASEAGMAAAVASVASRIGDIETWFLKPVLSELTVDVLNAGGINLGGYDINAGSVEAWNAHIADGDIHVTAAQKDSWNAAAGIFIVQADNSVKLNPAYKGLWTEGFLSARGKDDSAGGSGGASLDLVWQSLTTNLGDYKDELIDLGHLPAIPYSKLTGIPAIPSVGDGTVTVKQNGKTWTFTMNQSGATTIELTDSDTTYESKAAASGGTDVSLVTTGEKYTWNTAYGWGDHARAGYAKAADLGGTELALSAAVASVASRIGDIETWFLKPVLSELTVDVLNAGGINLGGYDINAGIVDAWNAHIADGDIHVTAAQKDSWNAAASLFIIQSDNSVKLNPAYKGLWTEGFLSARGKDDSAAATLESRIAALESEIQTLKSKIS